LDALKDKPDVIALSNYDWNVNLNKAIISIAREISPNSLIVCGGPNIRKGRKGVEEFLRKRSDVDLYIINEGEEGMCRLVEFALNRITDNVKDSLLQEKPLIPNIAYLAESRCEMIFSEQTNHTGRTISYPSPWLSGSLDSYLNGSSFPLSPIIETNRGCPFQCTFCTWGSFEDSKVRTFDLDVVLEELAYIFKKSERDFYLIIGDANFGILPRDVRIASEIRRLAEKHNNITGVLIWSSKNTVERNLEIYEILGDLTIPDFAVQSFSKKVLKNVGRSNISMDSMQEFVDTVNDRGLKVYTDLLIGLPGETKESHIANIKEVDRYGFDHATIADIRLLKGSRMEEDDQVEKFGLETMWRIIPSSVGEYGGKRVIEYENCVVKTNSMSRNDFLELRLFHGYIFLLHKLEIGRPLLDFSGKYGLNYVDLIIKITKRPPGSDYPLLSKQIDYYLKNAHSEWFKTEELANAYYLKDDIFDRLLKEGFPKLDFDYATKIIFDTQLRKELFSWIVNNIHESIEGIDATVLDDIAKFCSARIHSFPISGHPAPLNVSSATLVELKDYVRCDNLDEMSEKSNVEVNLTYDKQKADALNNRIEQFTIDSDMYSAIQTLLQKEYKKIYMDGYTL